MEETIIPISIEDKMREAYLNYSLSVIISRALPDVRDGLKPVHRRILYAANELNLYHNKAFKKSARIVGEVLGKYHPHGDAAVYEAMVRMAQDFNQRYPLIDGHGNFGSIDGDSPAAMRYTEVRLTELAEKTLTDIKQDTVNFIDNFDGSLKEPVVLPTRIPNLLVNGTSGIAVGMSTDIPPHNLGEVIDGLIYLLKHPQTTVDKIMKYIPGPDFPTGAIIVGKKGISEAYKKGKGMITLRGKIDIEKEGRKEKIIIKEIPYQVNKTRLIEEIAQMVNKDKIKNVSDLRDESDQDGLRIVVELKTNSDSKLIVNQLYKYTSLQYSFRINMLALVGKKPEVMDLKTIMQHFLDFRRDIITRRITYVLIKAKKKHHILQGLIKAIDKLDLVISIIRNSKSTQEAKNRLIERLKISDEQAKAILEMQLQRLVRMETEKLNIDANKIAEEIANCEEILNNNDKLDKVLKDELLEVKKSYNDKRRTIIIDDEEEAIITSSDLIKQKEVVITYSYRNNIKHTSSKEYAKSGKNDYITQIVKGTNLDTLLFFTQSGEFYNLPIHSIPEHHGLSTGESLKKYLKIPLKEKIIKVICLNKDVKKMYITIATKNGLIKKTIGEEYITNYSNIKAIKLNDEDFVVDVITTDGSREILLATKKGQTIKFKEESIKNTGRYTIGSMGIKLKGDDEVIKMNLLGIDDNDNEYLISISDTGKAKKTNSAEYKLQKRNGKGLKTCGSNIYQMASVLNAKNDDYLLLITNNEKQHLIKVEDITKTNRLGNMYRLINLDKDEYINNVFKLPIEPNS